VQRGQITASARQDLPHAAQSDGINPVTACSAFTVPTLAGDDAPVARRL
jgi:hypothetical protein